MAATDTGAQLVYGNDKAWGFLTLTISKDKIVGETLEVGRDGAATPGDKFEYSAAPVTITGRDAPNL